MATAGTVDELTKHITDLHTKLIVHDHCFVRAERVRAAKSDYSVEKGDTYFRFTPASAKCYGCGADVTEQHIVATQPEFMVRGVFVVYCSTCVS
jgi:hypothetical protein